MRRSILALIVALAGLLGACTNPSGGGGGASGEPAAAPTSAPQEPGYGY